LLSRLWNADIAGWGRSRAVTAENPTGAPGQGGRATEGTGLAPSDRLGVGWKISPSVVVAAGETFEMASISGPGVIRHIWITTNKSFRQTILRIFWEGSTEPAVECPLGDFFCSGWSRASTVTSLPVNALPNGGLNCYWEMAFRQEARITLENLGGEDVTVYYQVDYSEVEVGEKVGYLHANWRRENPLNDSSVLTLLDWKNGAGIYVGTYMAIGLNHPGWWGEGEVKFFIDDDAEFPTICGTGTEDYFGGAYNFDVPGKGYTGFSAPFLGVTEILRPDGLYYSQHRFGMYRWHISDPVAFQHSLRVTIQDLGWQQDRRYLQRRDDIATVAYWYGLDPGGLERQQLDRNILDVGLAP
jgi:hypothetical protein